MLVAPVAILVLLLLIGAIVAGIAMLFSPRTRVAGLVVLGLPMVLVLLLFVGVMFTRVSYVDHRANAQMDAEMARTIAEQEMLRHGARPSWTEPIEVPGAPQPQIVVDAAPGEQPAEKPDADTIDQPSQPAVAKPAEAPTAPDRPAWVDRKNLVEGDAYQTTVVVGPYATPLECHAHRPDAIQGAIDEFVAVYIGREWAGRLHLPDPNLRSQLVKAEWKEDVNASFGPMVQYHVLLEFDRRIKDSLKDERNQHIVGRRLGLTGTAVGALLLTIALAFAGLKVDLATDGAARGRLALAMIAGLTMIVLATSFVGYGFLESPVPTSTPGGTHTFEMGQGPQHGQPLTPVEAMYKSASWARLFLAGIVAIPLAMVLTGGLLASTGKRSGKLLLLAGAVASAILVAALFAIVA
jgi:hypothetical protein